MNKTIHLSSKTLKRTILFSLSESVRTGTSSIGFFLFALVHALSIWIEASRRHAALAGVQS